LPNLSVRILDKLPNAPEGKRDVYHDDKVKGLSVRVTSKGLKSFIVRKKKDGKDSLNTVGHYPTMTIEQARQKARTLLHLFDSGINPKQQQQEQQSKSITLEQVFSNYIVSRGTNLKDGTKKGYKSAFNNYLKDWASTPIINITRDMVEQKHRIITEQSPTRANTVMRQLRAYFNYAIGEYEDGSGNPIFTHNPVSRLSHIKAWNREKRKQTIIKTYDLKKWYDAVMELPQHQHKDIYVESSEVCRDLFLFILFTGLRRSEASNLMWSNVDFKDYSLTIEDTKNHEAHSLPLTPFLLEILERRKSDGLYIFQGSTPDFKGLTPDRPIINTKNQVNRVRKVSGIYFSLHDLRRTFITIAESLDINTYALKQLLNHKDRRDVTGGYIIIDMERLREPMNKITDYILEQVK
jgi:integrase